MHSLVFIAQMYYRRSRHAECQKSMLSVTRSANNQQFTLFCGQFRVSSQAGHNETHGYLGDITPGGRAEVVDGDAYKGRRDIADSDCNLTRM